MSEFHRILLGIHAQARRVDRDQAMLGALGVAALPYPHQLDSVHRMITGTACRWLLADEVGLGKTIQAIMAMRALAAQSAKPLRAALVVPDDLVSQWLEELLCRGHVLAPESGEASGDTGNLVLRLVRPSLLGKDQRIAAERVDLLLVDEFPRLTAQVRHDLTIAARSIRNIILMTATPTLHLAATRSELLSILEPEADRIARAEGRDVLDILAEREQSAEERYRVELQDGGRRRAVEGSFGLYRRIIRAQRSDYPDALPQRVYQPVRLAPTDGDVERGRTTRDYLSAARGANLDIRSELLLQVAGRSPQSLRRRLSTLTRTTPDLRAAWGKIDNCVREEPGDARLDALVDHIRAVHARNPTARIVVVAEDDPTTDYLREALEKLADVQVASKRRPVSAADELEVQIATLKEALDDFISGEAKVLVAADAAREGHNLQFAGEIVFYALPWSPPDIQQWIGRIDRLGGKGLPSKRRIAVTPLVVEGSIESRILEVLESTGVFQRSEVFDDSQWAEIGAAINAAAYGMAGASWGDAAKRARSVGTTYDEWLLATRFPPSPRSALAEEYQGRLRDHAYAAPFQPVDGTRSDWFQRRELAVETLLRLAREDHLDIRQDRNREQAFRTMWYKSRPREGDLFYPELDAQSPKYRQAYIARRAAIDCPPRTHVIQKDKHQRRLRFFDHGDALHDSVIATLERHAPKSDLSTEFIVEYPDGHPILRWEGRRLLFAAAELDLAGTLVFEAEAAAESSNAKLTKPEQDARTSAGRRHLAEFEADRRWLRDLCPPDLVFAAIVEDAGEMTEVVDAASALFDPFHGEAVARQRGKLKSPLSPAKLRSARDGVHDQVRKASGERRRRAALAVGRAAQARLFEAQADADNLVAAARAELDAAMRLDDKYEFNRAQQRAAQLTIDLAEAAWAHRRRRIETAVAGFESVEFKSVKLLWVLPRRFEAETAGDRR